MHKFKKKYGQNFISDTNLLNKIVSLIEINPKDTVIEVGPGSGNLTEILVNTGASVIVYEIDQDLEEVLKERFGDQIRLVMGDFLTRDLNNDLTNQKNIKMVANLPYYITTPIIMKILNSPLAINEILIMVQKEVGLRFMAKPNTKEYNAVSVILQNKYEITKELDVSKKVFFPIPKVDSVVMKLKLKEKKLIENHESFQKLVKNSFALKRKTLKNNLSNYNWNEINEFLLKYGYADNVRAEQISVVDFQNLNKWLNGEKVDKT